MNHFSSLFRAKWYGLLCVCVLLSACQSVPKSPPLKQGWLADSSVFVPRQNWHSEQHLWKLTGKIGINTPELRESANLVWQVDGDQNTMRLFGPLGVGSIRIEFDRRGVVLTDNKGVAYRGQDAQQLLSEITGWPIPIDALRYWLFALPAPVAAYQYQLDHSGSSLAINQADADLAKPSQPTLTALEQLGWSISYAQFVTMQAGAPQLPRKIIATRTETYGGEQQSATVRLIIKSWSPL